MRSALEAAIARVVDTIHEEAPIVGAALGINAGEAAIIIIKSLNDVIPKPLGNLEDKRAVWYRVRLTLFRDGGLVGDTDPEIAMNKPGVELIKGLAAVGAWAREITQSFYEGQSVEGLDDVTIARSIKSLRPSLSRNEGTHNWRMGFTVGGHEGHLVNILVVTEQGEATTP